MSGAKLVVKREFVNPLAAAVGYLIQQGFFSQFWFIGSLIIVQLLSPLLNRLLHERWTIFQVIIWTLGIICLTVISISYYAKAPLAKEVVQTFRLWTWLFYFMLGAALRRSNYLTKMSRNSRLGFFVFTAVTVQIGAIIILVMLRNDYAEYDYDSIFVMVAVVMLMLLYSQIISLERGRMITRLIHHFAANTMGIFIVHLLILKIVLRLAPISTESVAPLTIIMVFLIYDLFVSCLHKIPFASRLVSID